MKRQHLVYLAIAAGVLLIGTGVFDASSGWLVAATFLILCPLMMVMMMGGMHMGGHGDVQSHGDRLHDAAVPRRGNDAP